MECSIDARLLPRGADMCDRRSAIRTLGTVLAIGTLTPWTISLSRSAEQGAMTMNQYALNNKTISETVGGGGLLVVAQWEAKEGQADKVAAILDQFLPEAQKDPGAKLFLIGRNKERLLQDLHRRPGLAAAGQTRTRAIRAAVNARARRAGFAGASSLRCGAGEAYPSVRHSIRRRADRCRQRLQ
jgi:hypothetical protein